MRGRFIAAAEAMQVVKSGDRVFIAMGGEPTCLIEALLEERDHLNNVEIISGLSLGEYKFLDDEYRDTFRYSTWQIAPHMAWAIRVGRAQFLPIDYAQVPALTAPGGPLPIDVALVSLSAPDKQGFLSCGVSAGHTLAAAKNAKVVVAEINRQMPRTHGGNRLHVSEIDFLVEVDHPLIEMPLRPPDETDARIGRHVASLIPDGATLELGFGAIPNAIYRALTDKKDLGIHSGMITDGLIDLVESGAVTNSKKKLDRGTTVTGEVMGSQAIFEFVRDNPSIEMHSVDYTHSLTVLSQFDDFCAINSAVEVDLSGQINAEFMRGVDIGAGGQFDFALGAALARGGKSIVPLRSTAMKGSVSRIVHRLAPGVPVTVPRSLVHYVVTEYGIADLRHRNLSERAAALISIAHPDFRDELRRSVAGIARH